MKLKKVLKKMGITNEEKIDFKKREELCKKISKKIYSSFEKYGIKYEDIYLKLINTEMYFADIEQKSDKVTYIYKNATIYIDRSINIDSIGEEFLKAAVYKVQEERNNRNKIENIGLCNLNNIVTDGIALNEAGVEYIMYLLVASKKRAKVNAYDININSISEIYPMLTNILEQMIFITGEEAFVKSLLYAEKDFKKCFIKECSREIYELILKNMDYIYRAKNKIISMNREILFNSKLNVENKNKLREKIDSYEAKIKSLYLKTQSKISEYYFWNILENCQTAVELEVLKSKVGKYRKIIGKSTIEKENTFDKFSLDFYYRIEEKINNIDNKSLVVSKKESLNYIRKAIQKLTLSNANTMESDDINKQN